jgi:hypothetical protein
MRLTSELDHSVMGHELLDTLPGPYWIPKPEEKTPKKFLINLAAKSLRREAQETIEVDAFDIPLPISKKLSLLNNDFEYSRKELIELLAPFNDPVNRLMYLLLDTYGAPDEFENRRKELAVLSESGDIKSKDITDDMVVEDFVNSVKPDGWMTEFLRLGDMAKIIGSTLYVHGGVMKSKDEDCIGKINGREGAIPNVREWVSELNSWKNQQLFDWLATPQWKEFCSSTGRPIAPSEQCRHEATAFAANSVSFSKGYDARGGQALMEYVADNSGPVSVVMSRHTDEKGMPFAMPPDVVDKLKAAGIFRLVAGHTPHGSAPTVVREQGTPEGTAALGDMDQDFFSFFVDSGCSGIGGKRGQTVPLVDVMSDSKVRVKVFMGTDYMYNYKKGEDKIESPLLLDLKELGLDEEALSGEMSYELQRGIASQDPTSTSWTDADWIGRNGNIEGAEAEGATVRVFVKGVVELTSAIIGQAPSKAKYLLLLNIETRDYLHRLLKLDGNTHQKFNTTAA